MNMYVLTVVHPKYDGRRQTRWGSTWQHQGRSLLNDEWLNFLFWPQGGPWIVQRGDTHLWILTPWHRHENMGVANGAVANVVTQPMRQNERGDAEWHTRKNKRESLLYVTSCKDNMLLLWCNLYLSGALLRWKMPLNYWKKKKRMMWESPVMCMTLKWSARNDELRCTYWTGARLCCWKQQFHVCSWRCTGTRTRTVRPSRCWCPPPGSRSGASWSRWGHPQCRSESRFLSRRNWGTKPRAVF